MFNLIEKDHPLLKTRMEEWDWSNPPTDPIQLITDMAKFMYEKNGYGLAANQLGLPYRVFIIRANPNIACFNPIIVNESDEKIYMEEGCLSFPGLFINIKRPRKIRMRFQQPNGETVTEVWEGMTARIAQHELDHLNGITFLNRSSTFHLEKAKNKKVRNDRLKRLGKNISNFY